MRGVFIAYFILFFFVFCLNSYNIEHEDLLGLFIYIIFDK